MIPVGQFEITDIWNWNTERLVHKRFRGILKDQTKHTVYAPPSCFITHRYKGVSSGQRYSQFQRSSTSSPRWSTSKGMTSWIGRTKVLPSAPRSTAVLWAPSLPTFSPSSRAFFQMCLGRWSSRRRTMSPARTLPDLLFGWETSWKFLNSRRYYFSQRFQKSSASFCVFGVPSWDFSPFVVLRARRTLLSFWIRPHIRWTLTTYSDLLQEITFISCVPEVLGSDLDRDTS